MTLNMVKISMCKGSITNCLDNWTMDVMCKINDLMEWCKMVLSLVYKVNQSMPVHVTHIFFTMHAYHTVLIFFGHFL